MKIFLVEDDRFTAEMLSYHLSLNPDNDVTIFSSGKELLNGMHKMPHLIFLDYHLKDGEVGDGVFKKIRTKDPHVPVVIVSGQEDIATAVNLLKEGAYDYVVKDDNMKERIWNITNFIRNQGQLVQRVNVLQKEVETKYAFSSSIIGNSKALKQIFPLIEKACASSIVVSISGETGTGKEVLAKTIHYSSNRKDMPFVAVNVGAIPADLIESELFGHEKGAFTGATDKRSGKFEEAQGGTIFLDEIGDMPMAMQVKLLRVLQEQQVTRVGSNKVIDLDIRVIIATHRNLLDEVAKGTFREDLYYRLLGITIELPPLRDRGEDVIVLAKHFIETYAKQNGVNRKTFAEDAVDKLMAHTYPGNVRELKSLIELAMVMAEGDSISAADVHIKHSNNFTHLLSRELSLKEYNAEIIKHFLALNGNKVRPTAKRLGIGKSTIYRMFEGELTSAMSEDDNGEELFDFSKI
jgi:DNA-binding NtrC family response regulator